MKTRCEQILFDGANLMGGQFRNCPPNHPGSTPPWRIGRTCEFPRVTLAPVTPETPPLFKRSEDPRWGRKPKDCRFYGLSFEIADVLTLTAGQAIWALKGVINGESHPEGDLYDGPAPGRFLLDRPNGTAPLVTFDIIYPVEVACRVTVPSYTVARPGLAPCGPYGSGEKETETVEERAVYGMTVGYVIWCAASAYQQVFEQPEKFGVWGHALGDLGFEGLWICPDGRAGLAVGS